MKTRLALFILTLCGAFAMTSAYGASGTWTGAGDGTNLAVGANWTPGLPGTAGADVAFFDGYTNGNPATNLVLHYNNGAWQSGFQSSGVNLYVTSNQVGSVTIMSDQSPISTPIAIWNITNDIGAGAFTFGGTDANHMLGWIGRPQATPFHTLMNNSTNTATLTPWIQYTAGGAVTWTLGFAGTGNWQVNSEIVNNNGAGMLLEVDGPGTVFWNPQGYIGANGLNSPIVINAGTLVMQAHSPKVSNQAFTLTGTFVFDAPNDAQTLSGVISGAGTLVGSSGTLTLSGASTYIGPTVLTNTGTLIVNRAEIEGTSGPLGTYGYIYMHGGTLQWSSLNTFDYSYLQSLGGVSRIVMEDGAQYNFNTGGQSVKLTGDFTGTGSTLTKSGVGTLSLTGGADYTGATTVNQGKLALQSAKSGTGNITVADGANLDIYNNGTVTPGTLTLGASSGATLEFDVVNSTSTPMLTANTLVSSGTTTINVNSGSFTVGQSYPLLTWTTGLAPGVSLGTLNGFVGNLSTNGNKIQLNITATALLWTGHNGNNWDLSTGNDWQQNGGPVVYSDGQPTLFDDTTSQFGVTVNALVQPKNITVNNTIASGAPYTITSSGANRIGGSASLTKSGDNMLTLAGGANTYTGITTVNNGILSVGVLANGGSASDIGAASSDPTNVVLNGGVLLYTGTNATADRLFSIGTAGGTIDAEGTDMLNLSNPGSIGLAGVGPHGLTLTGILTNILAGGLADLGSGLTSVTKSGTGRWILTGTNTYSGVTTVSSGQLQVGNGGVAGTLGNGNAVNSSQIRFNRTGSVTVPGNISGSGSVANDGSGTLTLTGNNSYSGGTTINAGTLQVGGAGTLNPNANVLNNGTFIMSSSTPLKISGFQTGISGTGNVIVGANSTLSVIDWSAFTGWLLINSGGSYQPTFGNEGRLSASVVTNNGTLLNVRQDNNVVGYSNNIVGSGKLMEDNNNAGAGDFTIAGTNVSYTGGTWIRGGGIVLGGLVNVITNDVSTNYVYVPGSGAIAGPVIFTNTGSAFLNDRFLTFNRQGETYTVAYNIISAVTDGSARGNQGRIIVQGTNSVVILTGNNSYPGSTTINANTTLQVGNGGSSGSVGSGAIIDNGTLIFNRSGTFSNTNAISGAGTIQQIGSGTTMLLSTNNSYTGDTTVSNGTLVEAVASGNLNLEGGYLAPGAPIGAVGALTVSNNLILDAGTLVVTVNKSLYPAATNSSVSVVNPIIYNGGTVEVKNYGPALVPGDTFYIFTTAIFGISAVPIVSPGVTFINNLEVDGSVTVATVASTGPHLTNSLSGNQFVLSWDASWAGSHLQVQTNTLAKGLGTNWVTIAGTDAATGYTNTVSKTPVSGTTNGAVFYRLINQ